MEIKAYAKLNLSLDVLDKREDNFHELNSVMGQIDLFDELTFDRSDEIKVNSDIEDDIILKTVFRLRELFNVDGGVTVSVKKNIPISAGFGGGSADAAATLIALNELWGLNLSIDELIEIGSEIGADVPFCIVGGSCFVSGKGEMVKKIELPEMDVLIINPGYEVSTKEAYEKLDNIEYKKGFSSLKLKSLKDVGGIANCLHNDFIHIQKDDVKKIIGELKVNGALNASITGKGPSVFGLFEDREKAEKAYLNLKNKYKFVWLGKTK